MFITARQIHDGHNWLPAGTTLEVNNDGTIVAILPETKPDTVFYDGVIAPGFVNVHCHLELSHMKGMIPKHTGLIRFLKTIPFHRNDKSDEEKRQARKTAYDELVMNGIVAVGDIANTTDCLDLRALDNLHVHTFIEALGFSDVNAARSFGFALKSYETYAEQPTGQKLLRQTITPHAPYSVSRSLFRMIDEHNKGGVLSIHNQESDEENKYYQNKDGGVKDLLAALSIDDTHFEPTGQTSIRSYLEWMSPGNPYIFVHNTCTSRQDVQYVKSKLREPFWCLCPNANVYIENRLPDIDMLNEEGVVICVGTDSLASNDQLCILSELVTIKEYFPHITWETLLTWATYHGAWALQMQDTVGTIAVGKKPGIIQLTGLDLTDSKPVVTRIM